MTERVRQVSEAIAQHGGIRALREALRVYRAIDERERKRS